MSNKYRCIKTYPGSPKLGTVKKVPDTFKADNDELWYYITKFPEFWEPVIEKDYEILEVITNNDKFIEKVYNQDATIEPYWKIYSIRRKKDGEIFTIGDKVFGKYVNYTINKIGIVNDKCMVSALYDTNNPNGSILYYNLNSLKKVKKPLFTTEDGVDIYDKETIVYELFTSNYLLNKLKYNFTNHCRNYTPNALIFSTREKAEEYILMNKPCLSLNDIIEEVNSHRDTNNFQTSKIASWLKELANLKING
mgnify:CR=1 FL=1|jgi:hypothetical protein